MMKKILTALAFCLFATFELFAQCGTTPTITVSGASPTCQYTTYSFTTQPGMTNYVWAISAGTFISGWGTNTVSVQWSGTGAQNISVTYTTGGGCTINPVVLPVTITARSVALITGNVAVCTGTQVVYSVPSGMNNYLWTIPTAPTTPPSLPVATVISGQGTNAITLVWSSPAPSAPSQISVTYIDPVAGGCGYYGVRGLIINQVTPTITGPSNGKVCLTSGNSTSFTTETGMSSYTWSVTPDGTVTSGQGTATANINWTTTGTKTVTVGYTSNGCVTSKSITVNANNPPPALTAVGATTTCINTVVNYTTTPGLATYNWFTSPNGVIQSGSGTNSVNILWRNGGAGTVSVTGTDANGCFAPPANTLNVTVNGATITGPTSACTGQPGQVYSVTPGSASYNWTISPNGTITSGQGTNTIQVTWNTANPGGVGVTYSGLINGCSGTNPVSLNVLVNASPIPTISGPTNVCQGSTQGPYSTEIGNSTYVWTSPGATINPFLANSVMVVWNVAGVQPLSVSYKNINNCTAVIPTTINVNVAARTITGLASVCAGTAGVVYTTEAGYSSYNWSIPSGGTITAGAGTNSVTVTWNTAGAQTINVLYTGANCNPTIPVTKNVTVNARPAPTITGVASACAGTTGAAYTTETGKTAYAWTVSAGGVITSGAGTSSINVTWNTAGAQTVNVSYADANGCTPIVPFSKAVTINARPVPVITGAAAVCINSPSGYTTETGKASYVWAIVGGTINSGQGTASANVTWTSTGAQSLSVTYTDANGCTPVAPTSKAVTVNARPVPTITGLTPVCANTAGITYTTETGKTGYVWTISAGGNITAGVNGNVATVTWNTAGAQTISVNYVDANGCTASAPMSKAVTVNARPSPTITGSASQCVNTSTSYTTDAGKTGYLWSIVGGTINSGLTAQTANVTWSTAGTQSISVTYTDANGCAPLVPFPKTVTVNPRPVPTITGVSTSCQGTTGVTYTTESGKTGYTWSISAGGSITGGSTSNVVTVSWNSTGAQTISVNYTDANGCVAATATSKPVTVNSRPVPTITGNPATCPGVAISFTTEAGKSGYVWAVSGTYTITGQGTSAAGITWSSSGLQTVSITYVDANGCSPVNPVVKNVTVHNTVTPTITKVGAACTDRTVQFTTATGMSNYLWNVPTGGTIQGSATTSSVTVMFDYIATTRTVTVSYNDNNGCASTLGSLNVVVNQSAPLTGSIMPGGEWGSSICGQETSVYSTLAPYNDPGTFVWTLPSQATFIRQGSVATGDAQFVYLKWPDLQQYPISLVYTNAAGCVSTTNSLAGATTKGTQQITGLDFDHRLQKTWGDAPFTLSPVSTSGLPVTWSVSGGQTDVVSQSGNTFTVLNAGSVDYQLHTDGNACYNLVNAYYGITVNKLQTHTLSYTPLPAVNCDFAIVQVTSSANQPVTKVSNSNAVALGNNTFKVFGDGYDFQSINNRNVVDAYLNDVPATVYWTPTGDAALIPNADVPFCANEGRSAAIQGTNLQNISVWGQPNVIWQWMRDGGDISGENNSSYVATIGGHYQVRLSRDICQYTSNEVTINTIDCTDFTVSPNPANNSFTITVPFTPHNTANFRVFSSTGVQKYNQNMSINNATLNVNSGSWTSGVYTVQGTFGTTIITKNIVIAH